MNLFGAINNPFPWLDIAPPYSCGSLCRDPAHLARVLEQFRLEDNLRFAPDGSVTRCNAFLHDATLALGCPVPAHLFFGVVPGKGPKLLEMNANRQVRWLRGDVVTYDFQGERQQFVGPGPSFGWEVVTYAQALARTTAGGPVVVGYDSGTAEPGHVAIGHSVVNGHLLIAQAGAANFCAKPLEYGFGTDRGRIPVTYFAHA